MRWLGVLLGTLLCSTAWAAPVQELVEGVVYVGEQAEFCMVSPSLPTIPENSLLEQLEGCFTPLGRPMGNFGMEVRPIWYRFTLHNATAHEQERLLVTSWTDSQAHLFRQDPATHGYHPIPPSPLGHHEFIFPIVLAPGEEATFLLRNHLAEGTGHLVELKLVSVHDFYEQEENKYILRSLYYGSILSLGLYNLFLWVSLRDKSYLLYLMVMVSNLGYMSSLDGMGIELFWAGKLNNQAGLIAGAFVGIFLLWFARDLLSLKTQRPMLHRLLLWLGWAYCGVVVMVLILPLAWIGSLVLLFGAIVPIFIWLAGALSARQGGQVARFFILGWSLYLAAMIISTLTVLGYEPFGLNFFEAGWLVKSGSFLEMILFSFALADRINQLAAEKLAAQKALAEEAKSHQLQLEAKVAERTQELTQANQTKDRFLTILAHDLRGPLGGITYLFNDVIHSGQDLDPALLEHIRQSTKNVYRLLETLLDWAKNQKGEIPYEPEVFPFARLANETCELLQAQANPQGVQLSWEAGDFYLLADYSMSFTILRNLVNNAIKFSKAGSSVRISGQKTGEFLEIVVADEGKGMSAEQVAGLFDLGTRFRRSPSPEGGSGGGLGLVLCRDFVAKHGGRIWVESELGQGSRFFFTLPLGQAGLMAQGPTAEEIQRWIHSWQVLLVEDDLLHQDISLKQLTRVDGWQIKVADSGEMALELARRQHFDLILMDVDLPGMDGITVAQQIRPNWAGHLIFLTSFTKAEIERRAQGLAMYGQLHKPLDIRELYQVLGTLFKVEAS